MNIQWYPGHMAKARRKIAEELKLVDIVIELIDARIPISSRNPEVDNIVGNKKRIIVLNKSDMADPEINNMWKKHFARIGITAILANSNKGTGLKDILSESKKLMKDELEKLRKKGLLHKTIRALVIGIPNVGKSTLINKLANRSIAQTGDKPGITKAKQWIRINNDFELLDTPGILWPKFDDETVGLHLALTGAIKDEILNIEGLSKKFIVKALNEFPDKLYKRYNIELDQDADVESIMNIIGRKRGCLLPGDEVDINRTASLILDDFRSGRIGLITLEKPEDIF
ncbi:ribosome biogenesis GTPase YlqF [Lutispora saccharofermentans]|uniref:Ribosome biogenesis GTPase A n=1 Tax=Lutispora saccharofermentans TaxID=3024236 RepID=A0ABT1N9U7_9FIRM|nr:ribosome biogenesis GTPase YlqF [Lutispora saccharofermentans]MCQ1528020.1 ribosome biogenesis GTPase YlqF [Lutispora saccharofermentans]